MFKKYNFNDIYNDYSQSIYLYFYRNTNNKQISEELTQEVFISAYTALPKFRGKSSLKTWIYRIAHNQYVSWYRKDVKYQYVDEEVEVIDYRDPSKFIESKEDAERIFNVLGQLKREYREIILLCDYHSLSYKEISNILEYNLPKVKVTIYRARMKFRQLYGEVGDRG